MTEYEHIKQVIADLTSREKLARLKMRDARTEAETYAEAIAVAEVELTRMTRPASPRNG